MNTSETTTLATGHFAQNNQSFTDWIENENDFFHWQAEKITLIQNVLKGLKPQGTIADIGCFTGGATEIYRATGFEKAVGFDACSEALEVAANRGIEPRFWLAGEEACPANDEEFDVIVAADVIEHIVNTDNFMRELHRILRPDGRAIITTPNLAFWLSRIRLMMGRVPWSYPGVSPTVRKDIKIDLNHIRISTRMEWENLFDSHSFVISEVKGWSILHAISGGMGIHLRQSIDRMMTKFPDSAFGLLFLLSKKHNECITEHGT